MATRYDYLHLETGDHLLLEDGGKLIINQREVPGWHLSGFGPLSWLKKKRVELDDEDVLLIILDDSDL